MKAHTDLCIIIAGRGCEQIPLYRFLVILSNPFAITKGLAKTTFRDNVPLLGRLFIILKRFINIFFYATSKIITFTQFKLCLVITLVGSSLIPFFRQSIVFRYTSLPI